MENVIFRSTPGRGTASPDIKYTTWLNKKTRVQKYGFSKQRPPRVAGKWWRRSRRRMFWAHCGGFGGDEGPGGGCGSWYAQEGCLEPGRRKALEPPTPTRETREPLSIPNGPLGIHTRLERSLHADASPRTYNARPESIRRAIIKFIRQ